MLSTDEELLRRYREHHAADAFELLYDRYATAIYRFLRRLTRNPAAAEDLTQQTFMRIHEACGSFDPRWSFRTWAFTIARRLGLNWLKRSTQAAEHCNLPEDLAGDPSPEGQALARLELERVERALGRMPRSEVEVLLLRRFEGLPFAEIASILGCTPAAAKMRAHRALLRLQAELEPPDPEGL